MIAVLNPIIEAGAYTIMDEPVTAVAQAEYIRTFPERGVFHVATYDDTGEVMGMLDVVPHLPGLPAFEHVGAISTFVALGWQRLGVGTALMDTTIEAARSLGYRKLLALIRADNPVALAFYEKQGFTRIGTARQHARVRGEYVDEVFAERVIGQGAP